MRGGLADSNCRYGSRRRLAPRCFVGGVIKAHCSAGDEYRVVGFRSGVFEAGEDVAGL